MKQKEADFDEVMNTIVRATAATILRRNANLRQALEDLGSVAERVADLLEDCLGDDEPTTLH
jgi:hypothetical protein